MENKSMITVHVARHEPLGARARDPDDGRAVMLASFVEADIQASLIQAREWLDALSRVERKELEVAEGTGNAFTLSIRSDGATLQNEVFADLPPGHYTHAELRAALQAVETELAKFRISA